MHLLLFHYVNENSNQHSTRLGKRFHHRHNAFPEFVKMLGDVSLTFFAMEVEHSNSTLLNSLDMPFSLAPATRLDSECYGVHWSMSVSISDQSAFDCPKDYCRLL